MRNRQILPLVITFLFLGIAAWVGYQIYLAATQMKGNVKERIGKKNVVFTKDGVRVGVKHVENEKYVDATQSWAVKAWNMSSKTTDKDMVPNNKAEKKKSK